MNSPTDRFLSETQVVGPSNVVRAQFARRPSHALLALFDRIDQLQDSHAQLSFLSELISWLRGDAPRFNELVEALRTSEQRKTQLRALLRSVATNSSAVALLADVGIDRDRGLWTAVFGRLARQVMPAAPDGSDLRTFLAPLLADESFLGWLEALSLSEELTAELLELVDPDHAVRGWLREAVRDSVALLSARACSLGLTLNEPRPLPSARASAFWRLPRACEALLGAESSSAAFEARAELHRVLDDCRRSVELTVDELSGGPVETRMVLRTFVVGDSLERLLALGELLGAEHAVARTEAIKSLVLCVVRKQVQYRTAAPLWAKTWKPLSRRIFEHTSGVGDHYITRTREDWHQMLGAGAGGGLVTVATAAFKLLLASAGLSLFMGGLLASLNYVVSFLSLQLFGFALATKQPSMTGAALAAQVEKNDGQRSWGPFSAEMAHIVRSQFAAVIGNLGAVIPGAVLVQLLLVLFGGSIVDRVHAEHVVESLNPIHSWTLIFGFATGVILWLSSVGGGWMENWARCRKLPSAIGRHPRLVALLGAKRARHLAKWIDGRLCGIGSNLSLGLLLGMVPAVAQFFGIGLEVRHVTLSTGSLAYAGAVLGPEAVVSGPFLMALLGLFLVGVLNLSVAFGLGLLAALHSRDRQVAAKSLMRAISSGLRQAFSEPTQATHVVQEADGEAADEEHAMPHARSEGVRQVARARSS